MPFVAQSVVGGDIGSHLPFVLHIESNVEIGVLHQRVADGLREMTGSATVASPTVGADLRRSETGLQILLGNLVRSERIEGEGSIEAGEFAGGFVVDPCSPAEFVGV